MASPTSIQQQQAVPRRLSVWCWRAIVLTALWWVLSDGAADSWVVGVPVIAVATWLSVRFLGGVPWSVLGLLRFVPVFLWQSLKGGLDVSARALSPGLQFRPCMVEYELSLQSNAGRLFFAFVVSLLPGTLSADLREKRLLIHALDERLAGCDELRTLERRIGRMLRENLSAEKTA